MFQLGLITYPENSKHYRPSNYEAMHYEFLDKTRYIVPETWNLTRDDPAHRKIQTTLGRRILKLMSAGVEFDEHNAKNYICCQEAEWLLLANINIKSISDSGLRSPVVVTRDDCPVGIIKTYGDTMCYGLHDVPENGIIAGTFSALRPALELKKLPPVKHSWAMPLEAIGTLDPIRFSAFSIPLRHRSQLPGSFEEQEALGTDHEYIVKRAVDSLFEAVPMTNYLGVVAQLRTLSPDLVRAE